MPIERIAIVIAMIEYLRVTALDASALSFRCSIEAVCMPLANEPVELEPPDQVNSHLSGISHSPANELIQTYFENTYLRPAPVAAAPVAAETAP